MYLIIDNSGLHRVLYIINKTWHERKYTEHTSSSSLLLELDILFSEYHLSLRDLKGIAVVVGRGSFTAVRRAVTIANTLAYIFNIPVIGIANLPRLEEITQIFSSEAKQQYISAKYSKEPRINF